MGRSSTLLRRALWLLQMVIIDRAGVIRAQSGVRPGDPKLEDENARRVLIDGLLKEKAPNGN